MNEMTDFQRYCAGLSEMDALIAKAKLLRDKEAARRFNQESWKRLADEMIECLDKRLQYLDGVKVFKKITQTAADFEREYGQNEVED
jgi:hypothetical protein